MRRRKKKKRNIMSILLLGMEDLSRVRLVGALEAFPLQFARDIKIAIIQRWE